ncbi:hypothetical protein L9F63_009629, partial [Diploptera punctata]
CIDSLVTSTIKAHSCRSVLATKALFSSCASVLFLVTYKCLIIFLKIWDLSFNFSFHVSK